MIIDISHYNKIKDWNKVALNVDGIIIRLGYRGYGSKGTLVEDKNFQQSLKECLNRNIPWGVYFVTQATNYNEALSEAAFVTDLLEGKTPPLGIWLDSEYSAHPKRDGRADRLSKADRTEFANVFLTFFEGRSGLYSSDSWLDTHLVYTKLNTPNFWIARYSTQPPSHSFDLWQYTSKGSIPGIQGHVDLNKGSIPFLKPARPYIGDTKASTLSKALEEAGYESSFKARKEYARELGICEYKGTKIQNELLFRLLKEKTH